MNAGTLTDLVVFERRTLTENALGQMVETWAVDFSAYADVSRSSETAARFTIWFKEGISAPTHRVIWEESIWTITSAVHDRRRTATTIDSDFSAKVEVTHLQSTEREFIDGLPIVQPPTE